MPMTRSTAKMPRFPGSSLPPTKPSQPVRLRAPRKGRFCYNAAMTEWIALTIYTLGALIAAVAPYIAKRIEAQEKAEALGVDAPPLAWNHKFTAMLCISIIIGVVLTSDPGQFVDIHSFDIAAVRNLLASGMAFTGGLSWLASRYRKEDVE